MSQLRLTIPEKEREKLESVATGLNQSRQASERNRLCVVLGYNEGLSVEELSKTLRLSPSTIYNYLNDYIASQKTQNTPKVGAESKLNKEQSESLIKYLQEYTYSKVKDICAHVAKEYGVIYSRSGMTKWLKEQGFVYKKPKRVPGKLDPSLQEGFIKEYEALKSGLGAEEEIYFVDAVHPVHQSQAVCGWIKKGEEKTLQTTGTQLRMHLNGALCLNGKKMLTAEYTTIDADSIVDFLKKVEASSSAKAIYVIMDNARSNKNKKVEEYLKESRIKIRYLPPYSPNLNPIERVWKLMRETKLYNRYYASSVEFFGEIRSFFKDSVPIMVHSWSHRINDNFERIKPNPIKPVF